MYFFIIIALIKTLITLDLFESTSHKNPYPRKGPKDLLVTTCEKKWKKNTTQIRKKSGNSKQMKEIETTMT